MRIAAWILLIVGVGLAGAGGAQMGSGLASVRAYEAPADMLGQASGALQAAFAEQAVAMDGLRAEQKDAEEAVSAANAAVKAARDRIEGLREAGLWQGSFTQAVLDTRSAVPVGPTPQERLMQWLGAGGPPWGLGVLFVVVGALLERRAAAQASQRPDAATGAVDYPRSISEILSALQGIQQAIAELDMDAPSVEPRAEIDRVQDELITPLVEARAQLVARHGTSAFSVYFGAFSAGERNLARTWSALTDGHSVVARASLEQAIAAFEQSLVEYEQAG